LESAPGVGGEKLQVQSRPGELGQYDVMVDGEVVATRRRSVLGTLFGGGWPTADDVLQAIAQRTGSSRG
jgi:hypothetical protein